MMCVSGHAEGKDDIISKLEKELQAVKNEVQSMKENPPKKKQKLTEGETDSSCFVVYQLHED